MKRQKKEIRITFRVTPEQYEHIEEKAEIAQMSIAAYVRAAAMRHRVAVVDGLKEFTHELKGIGRSLNQQTILANERRVTCLGLWDAAHALENIYDQLKVLTNQERR